MSLTDNLINTRLLEDLGICINRPMEIELYSVGGVGEVEFINQLVCNILLYNETTQVHYINLDGHCPNDNIIQRISTALKLDNNENNIDSYLKRVMMYDCFGSASQVDSTLKFLSLTLRNKNAFVVIGTLNLHYRKVFCRDATDILFSLIQEVSFTTPILYIRTAPPNLQKNDNDLEGRYRELGGTYSIKKYDDTLRLMIESIMRKNSLQQCVYYIQNNIRKIFECNNTTFTIK
ncbi:Uncharacterized protein QTN25_007207 [Entamoeba marina]